MNTRQPAVSRPVVGYFENGNREWAVAALRTYCEGRSTPDGWLYSGGWFDRLAKGTEPDCFTAADLVAVTMLSVSVPAHAAIRILETERDHFTELLRAVGPDRPIWEADEAELASGSPANRLWASLRGLRDVGPVIASKLMAAKRPNLIPVYDRHVYAALGWQRAQFWLPMRSSMIDAHRSVNEVIDAAGVAVTALRAVDIVVWMHQHGWRWAKGALDPPPPRAERSVG